LLSKYEHIFSEIQTPPKADACVVACADGGGVRHMHGHMDHGVYCRVDRDGTGASGPRGGCARDFVNFRGEIMDRARAARPRGFDSLPIQDPDPGRCQFYSSAESSKIKIRTSSCNKAN
jgi:hypothetical protein